MSHTDDSPRAAGPMGSELVAVVTGASRGVGRGIALGLGRGGATVFVTGRTAHEGGCRWPGSLAETVAEINRLGGVGIAVRCDHERDEDTVGLFERVAAERPRLDVLVNCAYSLPEAYLDTPRGVPFWELPLSVWDHSFGVGLRAHYVASRLAARRMITQGAGVIVNVSSSGADGYQFNVPYGVAKTAIERMTADMAVELRPHGVTVVALRPGPVHTERMDMSPFQSAARKRLSPQVVGDAVLVLVSSGRLSEWSGCVLSVTELLAALEALARPAHGAGP